MTPNNSCEPCSGLEILNNFGESRFRFSSAEKKEIQRFIGFHCLLPNQFLASYLDGTSQPKAGSARNPFKVSAGKNPSNTLVR